MISDFVLHSGGAKGADLAWQTIGQKHGLRRFKHYYVQSNKTPHGNTYITLEQAKKADTKLLEVVKVLNRRFPTNNEYVNNLLRRNAWQVGFSEAIFAVSSIKDGLVQGGTGWAAHMAILVEKPVFVFDQFQEQWFVWAENRFVPHDTPVLTKEFAGIGTREINAAGLSAIENVYKKTINDEKNKQD